MRAMSVMRFAVLGAVGFGAGGAVATVTLLVPLIGAIGGASLGLALKDGKKAGILALLGALGTYLGIVRRLIGLATLSLPEPAQSAALACSCSLQPLGAALGQRGAKTSPSEFT